MLRRSGGRGGTAERRMMGGTMEWCRTGGAAACRRKLSVMAWWSGGGGVTLLVVGGSGSMAGGGMAWLRVGGSGGAARATEPCSSGATEEGKRAGTSKGAEARSDAQRSGGVGYRERPPAAPEKRSRGKLRTMVPTAVTSRAVGSRGVAKPPKLIQFKCANHYFYG